MFSFRSNVGIGVCQELPFGNFTAIFVIDHCERSGLCCVEWPVVQMNQDADNGSWYGMYGGTPAAFDV